MFVYNKKTFVKTGLFRRCDFFKGLFAPFFVCCNFDDVKRMFEEENICFFNLHPGDSVKGKCSVKVFEPLSHCFFGINVAHPFVPEKITQHHIISAWLTPIPRGSVESARSAEIDAVVFFFNSGDADVE